MTALPQRSKERLSIAAIAKGVASFYFIGTFVILMSYPLLLSHEITVGSYRNEARITDEFLPNNNILFGVGLIFCWIFFCVGGLTGFLTASFSEYRVKAHCSWVGICITLLPQIFFVPQFCFLILTQSTHPDNILGFLWLEVGLLSVSLLMVPFLGFGGYLYELMFGSIKPILLGVMTFIGLGITLLFLRELVLDRTMFSRLLNPLFSSSCFPILFRSFYALIILFAILIPITTGYISGKYSKNRVQEVCISLGVILSIATFCFLLGGNIIIWSLGNISSISTIEAVIYSFISISILPLIILGGYLYEKRNFRVSEDKSLVQEYFEA